MVLGARTKVLLKYYSFSIFFLQFSEQVKLKYLLKMQMCFFITI